MTRKPTTIRLTAKESEQLLAIASDTGSLSSRGRTKDKPSWQVMLKRIAQGELVVLPACDERLHQVEVPVVELLPESECEVNVEAECEAEAVADVSQDGARVQQEAVLEAYSECRQHHEPAGKRAQFKLPVARVTPVGGRCGASGHQYYRASHREYAHYGNNNEATPVTNRFTGQKRGRNAPPFSLGGQMASFPSIRIGITGSTESGKSTAVHNILLHALRFRWKSVILLDGKGSELCFYQHLPGVIYFGRDETSAWADILHSITQEYSARYAELTRRGLRVAPDDEPGYLVVIDEVQRGVRDELSSAIRKAITINLQIMSEQCRALGDCLLVTSQREEGNIPKAVRHNLNTSLHMLGAGYFNLWMTGHPPIRGRTTLIGPTEVLKRLHEPNPIPLDQAHLSAMLGGTGIVKRRAMATLYQGKPGSGRTYQLNKHSSGKWPRVVYVDCSITHREALIAIIEQCQALAPSGAKVHELLQFAIQALASKSTLLLVDNLDLAPLKAKRSVLELINWSSEVALACSPPRSARKAQALQMFMERCQVVPIEPLTKKEAEALADEHLLAEIEDREIFKRRIAQLANGHPKTIVNFCLRVRHGTLTELREIDQSAVPPRYVDLKILLLLPLFVVAYNLRDQLDFYWLSLIAFILAFVLRSVVRKGFLVLFGGRD